VPLQNYREATIVSSGHEQNDNHQQPREEPHHRNIIDAVVTRQGFLLLGHKTPDEDCIASMVAFALLGVKFSKNICIYLGKQIHEHFHYLLNKCHPI
jgi:nanoRNase/pAp phosphatase (c-di-AMP/oligoRNAs hydrolase)